jgi:hypothetical protein
MNTAIEIAKRMKEDKRSWAGHAGELIEAVLSNESKVARMVELAEKWLRCRRITATELCNLVLEVHGESNDIVEYLSTLPPEGSQLLNVKAGEALPADSNVYVYDGALGWVPSLSSYAQDGRIYAHKPVRKPEPFVTQYGGNSIGSAMDSLRQVMSLLDRCDTKNIPAQIDVIAPTF